MMMRFVVLILLVIPVWVRPALSQENQLIYTKIIPGTSLRLEKNADTSGYVLTHHWHSFDPPIRDIGVWNEVLLNRQIEGTKYNGSKILYTDNLEPENELFYLPFHTNYAGNSQSTRMIINFNNHPGVGVNATVDEFPTYPAVENYPSPTYGQNIFMKYNPITETLKGLLNVSSTEVEPGQEPEPFSGYNSAANPYYSMKKESYRNTTMINDSAMIAYVVLSGEQSVNNTEVFTNYGGQFNLLRIKMNLNSGQVNSQQIGSPSGSQHVLHVSFSPASSAVYRMGIVRGINTPVSTSGEEVEMAPNDSLYHVYLTKEAPTGQTQWLTELYAYNNLYPDTVPPSLWINKLAVQNHTISVIERNEFLYVNATFVSEAHLNDSILYRDFRGQDYLLANYLPWHELMSEERQIPFSESRIYRVAQNGNVLGKLSTKNIAGSYDNASYDQNATLIEIEDRMAWLQAYRAVTDTTVVYTYLSQNGSVQNTPVDLPAGKGIYVLWLTDDLHITDRWVIPFESDLTNGMRINSIVPYHGDTLIIQGVLNVNTVTDLDPFGESEPIVASEVSSFFAFYSAPEIFTNIGHGPIPTSIKIYPNPASEYIRLNGLAGGSAKYQIIDLAGRPLMQGWVEEGETIGVENLPPGLYIFRAETQTNAAVKRFLIE